MPHSQTKFGSCENSPYMFYKQLSISSEGHPVLFPRVVATTAIVSFIRTFYAHEEMFICIEEDIFIVVKLNIFVIPAPQFFCLDFLCDSVIHTQSPVYDVDYRPARP